MISHKQTPTPVAKNEGGTGIQQQSSMVREAILREMQEALCWQTVEIAFWALLNVRSIERKVMEQIEASERKERPL